MLEGFIISIPIFYVLGLVSFIRYIARDKNAASHEDRVSTLKSIVPDLKNTLSKSDAKRGLESLIAKYSKEIEDHELPSVPEVIREETPAVSQEITQGYDETIESSQEVGSEYKSAQKQSLQIGLMWSRWYSDNSINLLLYVGAFLIVASAAIFVGFQWDAMPGLIKASAFSLVTLAFFFVELCFTESKALKMLDSPSSQLRVFYYLLMGLAGTTFILRMWDLK